MRQTILIIEDDPGLNLMIRHLLGQHGFEVRSALSGEEGLSLAARGPCLMLLDYALPDMLCTDLVCTLQDRGTCPPFVIVTGQGDERVAVEMMKLGARDYIIKDESLLELLPRVVSRACAELQREQALRRAREKIRQLNAELEERVQARTAELKEAHQRARRLMEVAEGANQASSPESALEIALRIACQQTGFQLGHAWWRSEAAPVFTSSGKWHCTDADRFQRFKDFTEQTTWKQEHVIPGKVLARQRTVWLPDVRDEQACPRAQTAGECGLRAGIFIPVLVDGEVRAILEVFSTTLRQESPDTLDFLTRIATQLGSVVRRRRSEDALRRARDLADQASRTKSMFLATMSHEIRTPMNAILGFAQVLLHDSSLDPRHHDNLQLILRSGDHLLQLIDDVLEMSKIEAGRIAVSEVPIDLRGLLEGLLALFQDRASARGLSIQGDIDARIPVRVQGDHGRLRQVLINLTSNAIKFTDQGGVQLSIGPGPDGAVCFVVRDTGVGIPEADHTTIFQPFGQGTHHRGGTGLGLAISHRLTELMGGSLRVESTPGAGSRFTLTLTLPEVPAHPDAPVNEPALSATAPPEAQEQPVISAGDLRTLPAPRRDALLHATLLGDIERLEEEIATLPVPPAIRNHLAALASDFQYDQLQALFSTSPPRS